MTAASLCAAAVSAHYSSMHAAVKMLSSRIATLRSLLQASQDGEPHIPYTLLQASRDGEPPRPAPAAMHITGNLRGTGYLTMIGSESDLGRKRCRGRETGAVAT